MAESFPTAPAMQRWFAELQRLDEMTHLSGRVRAASADWSLLTVTLLSARLAGWGDPVAAVLDGPGGNDPPEVFGATSLLRTFWSDIAAGRRPVLGAEFLLTIERLGHRLIPAR